MGVPRQIHFIANFRKHQKPFLVDLVTCKNTEVCIIHLLLKLVILDMGVCVYVCMHVWYRN